MHESVPCAHAEGTQNEFENRKTDAHAEHARKELMNMLSGYVSVPYPYMLSVRIKVRACP